MTVGETFGIKAMAMPRTTGRMKQVGIYRNAFLVQQAEMEG